MRARRAPAAPGRLRCPETASACPFTPADQRDALTADASDMENPELSVDLVSQTIKRPNGVTIDFDIDPFRKTCLLEGLDDIGLTLEKSSAIDSYETDRQANQPWL